MDILWQELFVDPQRAADRLFPRSSRVSRHHWRNTDTISIDTHYFNLVHNVLRVGRLNDNEMTALIAIAPIEAACS